MTADGTAFLSLLHFQINSVQNSSVAGTVKKLNNGTITTNEPQ